MRFFGVSAFFLAFAAVGLGACSDDPSAVNPAESEPEPPAGPAPTTTVDPTTPPDPAVRCGAADVKKGASTRTITADGSVRSYTVVAPDNYDSTKTFPVVFVFHGDGGTGVNIRSSFKIEAEAAGGAIFVYPDGENKTWNIDDAARMRHDMAFIDLVAADLAKTHCSDKRVFAVGFSKGAYFANMLACLGKTPLRAVVAHSGGGPFGVTGSGTKFDGKGNLICPAAPVAAMQIVGSNDRLLGDAKKARDYWERLNACQATSKPVDPSPCVAFDACAADRPVTYCEIPGMGHSIWQNAPKVTWAFLKSK